MAFEALTCPVCRANMPYTELVSGKRIIQCQVCMACMENPRFGEFRSSEPVDLHLRMPFNGAGACPRDRTQWTGDRTQWPGRSDVAEGRVGENVRRATVRKVPEVVGYRRTVWPYLTALFASATVMFASTLILVGMGLVDFDFGALFGMVGIDGVDEHRGIIYTVVLTAGSMVSMMACNSMPSKVPVFEMVEEEAE